MTKKRYQSQSKWIVFDNRGKRIKTVTLRHEDCAHYKELNPFQEELKRQGLYAHAYESVNQEYLEGKTFKERLMILGWEFNGQGLITGAQW